MGDPMTDAPTTDALERVSLAGRAIDRALASQLPTTLAERYCAVVVERQGGIPVVAVAPPVSLGARDDIRLALGRNVIIVEAPRHEIEAHLSAARSGNLASQATDQIITTSTDLDPDGPVARWVDELLRRAISEGASDVHFDRTVGGGVEVRIRRDGVLRTIERQGAGLAQQALSRIKILGGMDIADSRRPQDGRFDVSLANGEHADIRAATWPSIDGEAVALRVLASGRGHNLAIDEIGLLPEQLAALSRSLRQPQGAILIAGPTGAGKTSTALAALSAIAGPELSTVSIEDPVEVRLAHVQQLQVSVKGGLTFPIALRAALRADPDVIFVGEIRDRETADVAAHAALTGQRVLATLHSLSAFAIPARLLELGVAAPVVAAMASALVGQRLARRVCSACRDAGAPGGREGCPSCWGTGFGGRVAIAEVVRVSPALRDAIAAGCTPPELEKIAADEGVLAMRDAAQRLVEAGETTREEIERVLGDDE